MKRRSRGARVVQETQHQGVESTDLHSPVLLFFFPAHRRTLVKAERVVDLGPIDVGRGTTGGGRHDLRLVESAKGAKGARARVRWREGTARLLPIAKAARVCREGWEGIEDGGRGARMTRTLEESGEMVSSRSAMSTKADCSSLLAGVRAGCWGLGRAVRQSQPASGGARGQGQGASRKATGVGFLRLMPSVAVCFGELTLLVRRLPGRSWTATTLQTCSMHAFAMTSVSE